MPKYRDYFRKMLSENEELFEVFSQIHAKYQLDQNKHQAEFNQVGADVLEVVREWEQRLCGHSEKGKNAVFSANLADKFHGELRAFFPMIDFVGVEVTSGNLNKIIKKSQTIKKNEMNESQRDEKPEGDLDRMFEEIEKISVLDDDDFRVKRLL